METPSSMRRGTKTQTFSVSQKSNQDVASLRSRNNGNQERPVLQDITNDSPINGIATEKTPLSSVGKSVGLPKKTPGSGEALLRGQVKILLEKVEEGAEFMNKISNRQCAPSFPGLGLIPISPGLLAAPTPANTPQIFEITGVIGNTGEEEAVSVLMEDVQSVLPMVAESGKHGDSSEQYRVCVLNRALLFDSPDKSEASIEVSSTVSSAMTYQGSTICSSYDDNWSIQANASSYTEDEEDELEEFDDDVQEEEEEEEEAEEEEDGEEEKGGYLDELCEGLRKITVEDKDTKLPEFTGKHTRFIYNCDDEIEGEEEIGVAKARSPSVVLLKGLPAPEGKHLRFHEEDEEE